MSIFPEPRKEPEPDPHKITTDYKTAKINLPIQFQDGLVEVKGRVRAKLFTKVRGTPAQIEEKKQDVINKVAAGIAEQLIT